MSELRLVMSGASITEKHTHFEGRCQYRGTEVLVTIPGAVADKFREQHGVTLQSCPQISIGVDTLDLIPNADHVDQNPYHGGSILRLALTEDTDVSPVK